MGTIVKQNTYVDGTNARPEHVNEDIDIVFAVINGNLDWDNLKASLVNAANGILKLDASGEVPLAQIPDTLTGKDADTVDTKHYSDITTKITADIATHAAIVAAHHARYTDAEAVAAVSVVTDHGALTGLADDDHPQYLLTSRASMGARRYLSSNQAVAHDTLTRVNLNAESWDIGSDFSNYKYTAPYTGYYQVNASIGFATVADKNFTLQVCRNGVAVIEGHAHSTNTGYITVAPSDIVYMSVGQYIELYAKHNAEVSRDVVGASRTTFMSVQLLCPTI